MSESEAKEELQSGLYGTPIVLNITVGPPQEMGVMPLPVAPPTLAITAGHPTRMVKKKRREALTPAQQRTRKIRAWMRSQFLRPNPETYRRAMDNAHISPPAKCCRAGKSTFEESFAVKALRGSVSAEFSRLWRTRA
jgi:hypothetical protein